MKRPHLTHTMMCSQHHRIEHTTQSDSRSQVKMTPDSVTGCIAGRCELRPLNVVISIISSSMSQTFVTAWRRRRCAGRRRNQLADGSPPPPHQRCGPSASETGGRPGRKGGARGAAARRRRHPAASPRSASAPLPRRPHPPMALTRSAGGWCAARTRRTRSRGAAGACAGQRGGRQGKTPARARPHSNSWRTLGAKARRAVARGSIATTRPTPSPTGSAARSPSPARESPRRWRAARTAGAWAARGPTWIDRSWRGAA